MKSSPTKEKQSNLPKLSAPAQRALSGAGITQLEQLTKVSESTIKALHGIGPNAIQQLRLALAARGLAFANDKREKK